MYLGVLKAVHKGDDIQEAAKAAQDRIPGDVRGMLGYVLSHLNNYQLLPFMTAAVAARTGLKGVVAGDRELLYLDLALERVIRGAAE